MGLGHQVGYAFHEVLYEGAETRVQRATHLASGEQLVVKLPVLDTPTPRTIGRLIHEYQILCKLSQVPGVVRCRGLTQQGSRAALWLENSGFRALDKVLAERGRLALDVGLRVALALCHILDGVHAAGVVHKDVKPQNILIDETGTQATLIDFGIASELAEEATEPRPPESLEGTLAYISPEQTGRTARGIDSRTDLYSLGVTLFEMLIGQPPFVERDPLAMVYAHLAKAPPAVESLDSGIPNAVTRILGHCLEKVPEKRYQTAKGLARDLQRCLEMLEEQGQIELFPLGQKDFSPKLQISQTLFGREPERQIVAAAFERAAHGSVEFLLLDGPSGVGKTALVRTIYGDIAKAGCGLFLTGKHDQFGRSVPYLALAQAFSSLMRTVAASPKVVFDAWRVRLNQALGPLLRVIADLVPELEWLTGPLPALQTVPTEIAYNRIKLSWIDFVRAVTDASPPLVLFLDDMQWVDPASVELLKTLLTDVGRKHLLVIAAFRQNEAGPDHPLWSMISAVEKSGVHTSRLTLGPLDEPSVQKWLAETLSTEPTRAMPLANALWRKTQGNPFFLGQLLLEFYQQKLVHRNLEDGTWQWDLDAVERAAVTDNVVELMLRRVEELPMSTQELLGQAACSGHRFTSSELSALSGLKLADVSQQLWPALQGGLVIPSDGPYREAQALAQTSNSSELEAGYQFLHDRVQQAFYERMPPEQRAWTHLQIGRRLQQIFERQGGSNQKLVELARHLNQGSGVLQNQREREELARLNLQAAKAAKANGSYQLQATLVEQAQKLLADRNQQEVLSLSVELALEHIEADYMLREFDAVHRRVQELLALPLPALPRLAAQELRVRACVAAGQYEEGVRLGLLALEKQGLCFPATSEACAMQAAKGLVACDAWLNEHSEGFSAMPADPAPEHLLCDALLAATLTCAAVNRRPTLSLLGLVRNVQGTIEKSTLTAVAPFFVATIAHGLSAILENYRGGARWTKAAVQAAERLGSSFLPQCYYFRGVYAAYEIPVEQTRKYYQAALRVARTTGSFQGTSWALFAELHYVELWGGRPLNQVAATETAQRSLMVRSGDALGKQYFALAESFVSFLQAPSNARSPSDAEWLPPYFRSLLSIGDGQVAELARILAAYLCLAFGSPSHALEYAESAERFRASIFGNPPVTDIPLWRGLAAAKCCISTLAQAEREGHLATLEQAIQRYRYLSEGCAENFLHKLRLLEAEYARLCGRTDEAMAKYDEAITLSQKEEFLHIEALADQFCAEFHLAAGRERIAALYLEQAHHAYVRWNADALVKHLKQNYSEKLRQYASITLSSKPKNSTNTASTAVDVAIDMNTTLRATQTLSSELDTQRVITELMRLVQENAGAQRAALLLVTDDKLLLSAFLSESKVRAGLAEPLSASHQVAQSVIQYVLRSREAVVVNDAPTDSRFAQDCYLHDAAAHSVLAVPLVHQGKIRGVIYLEHENAYAFPASRVQLLGILAAQSAIALENARLYTELQGANLNLENKVAERTAALNKALKEIWSEMDLAQKIQTALLPQSLQIPGYDLAAMMRPTEQVGGDYYDVFRYGNQDLVLIGDVSGHGIPAGLCMMMIQTAVRTAATSLQEAEQELTPSRLLSVVNQAVEVNLTRIGHGQYMTITALCIQDGRVRYAGLHLDILIYRAATHTVERIETEGVWLGVVSGKLDELLQDRELQLMEGDSLLLYTDGYTEATVAGRLIGSDYLADRFMQLCGKELQSAALVAGLLESVDQAVIRDDVTLLVLQRLAVTPEVRNEGISRASLFRSATNL